MAPVRAGIRGIVGPGVGDVGRHQRPALASDLVGDAHGGPVHLFEVPLTTDYLQLLAVGVIGQGDHDLGAGTQELAVQLDHRLWRVENDLGNVRPGLDVAAALEFEDVTLGAEDHVLIEALLKRSR